MYIYMYVCIYNVVAGKRLNTHAYIYVCVHVYIQILNPCLQKKKPENITHLHMHICMCMCVICMCMCVCKP